MREGGRKESLKVNSSMPNSRRRKKQVAASKRQMDRHRRRLQMKDEENYALKSPSTAEEAGDEDSKKGWLDWCTTGLTQGIETAKDMVFPTRALRRQLDVAQQRLKDMEDQLETVREKEAKEKKRKRKRLRSGCNEDGDYVPEEVTATAAPPPPPPPPPLPSLLPQRRAPIRRTKTTKCAKPDQPDSQPVVTLEDIKKVKLRSVHVGQPQGNCRQKKSSGLHPTVTLADLRSVTLKSTRRKSLCYPLAGKENEERGEFRLIRRQLRTVRSPRGGRRRRSLDSGQGPTPMLTRALRRKFQTAYPHLSPIQALSPSPPVSPIPPSPPPPSSQTSDPPSPPPPSLQTSGPPSPPPNSFQSCSQTTSPSSVLEIREI